MTPEEEQWREEHGFHPIPATHIEHWCFMYSVGAILFLSVYMALIYLLQRRRPSLPGDSLFLLHSWPRVVRRALPICLVLFLVVPVLLFTLAHLSAGILAPIEGWPFLDTFEYILCNMVAIPPMNDLVPAEAVGTAVDLAIAVINLVLSALVIGFCASMGWVHSLDVLVPRHCCGVVVAVFAISGIFALVGFLCAVVLALLEGFDVWQSFLYTMSVMCGIGNPLTDFVPTTDKENFFAALCSVVELGIGGAVVGLLAGHPKMLQAVAALDGTEAEEQADVYEGDERRGSEGSDGMEPALAQRDTTESQDARLEELAIRLAISEQTNSELCKQIALLNEGWQEALLQCRQNSV